MTTTPNLGLPLEVQGHVAFQESYKEAMGILDTIIQNLINNGGGGGGGSSTVIQKITLSPADITAKGVTLSGTPVGELVVLPQGGPVQISGSDYAIVDDFLTWDGNALETLVEAGMVFYVTYNIA